MQTARKSLLQFSMQVQKLSMPQIFPLLCTFLLVLETELVPVWFPSPLWEPFFAVMEAPCPCTAAAYSCWVWRYAQHVIETVCSDKEKMIEGGAWGKDCAAATGEKIWGKSRVAPPVGQNRRFCEQLGQHIRAIAIVELGTVMHIHPYVGAYMHTLSHVIVGPISTVVPQAL